MNINQVINNLEKNRFGVLNGFFWLSLIILIRYLLEVFLLGEFFNILGYVQFLSGFLSVFLLVCLSITFFSKENVRKVINIVLLFWPLIALPPILDKFIFNISTKYLFLEAISITKTLSNILFFKTFLLIPRGVVITFLISLVLSSFYIWFKTKSVFRTAYIFFTIYIIEVSNWCFPMFIFNLTTFDVVINNTFYSLLSIISFILLMYKYNKKITITLLKNIRPFRTMNFLILCFIGSFIFLKRTLVPDVVYEFVIEYFVYALFSIFFAWQFGIIINDIYDYEIDSITNKKRPLIKKIISERTYKEFAILLLILSILFALPLYLRLNSFLCIILFIFSLYIYSAPPFRFRKYMFHNAFIGLWSVLAFLSGYFLGIGHINYTLIIILICIFFGLFMGSTIKDLKDYKGDKKLGIKTIFTVFGFEKGKKISLVLLFVSFLLPSFLFNEIQDIVFFMLIAGLANLDFYKKESVERVFLYYFLVLFYCLLRIKGILI